MQQSGRVMGGLTGMMGRVADVYGDRVFGDRIRDSQEWMMMQRRRQQEAQQSSQQRPPQYANMGGGGYTAPNRGMPGTPYMPMNRGMPGRREGAGSR